MKLPTMLSGVAVGLVLAGLALAQNSTTPAPLPAVSQPAADGSMSRHTMTGEVTRVNADKGWLFVKTPEGRMLLHFPSSTLQNVKKGDSVTIELALKDNGPAPQPK